MQGMGDWGRWCVSLVSALFGALALVFCWYPKHWYPCWYPRNLWFPKCWLPSWLPRKPMSLDGTQRCGTRTGTHGKGHFRLRTWCMGKPSKKCQQKYPHHPNLDHQKCELLTQWDRTLDAGFMHTPKMIAVAFAVFAAELIACFAPDGWMQLIGGHDGLA